MWADIVTFPRLTNLEFAMGPSTVLPALGGANVPSTKIPLPRSLARLGLRVRSAVQLSVIDMDLISRIPLVCVAPESESIWLAEDIVSPFLSHVFPHPDEIEAILSDDSVSFRIINREHNRTRTRAFLNVASAAIAHSSLWESTFGIVTSLTLYISADFLKRSGAAACSNVEHLTVVLEKPPDNDLPDLWMILPKLRTLTLALAYPHRLVLAADAVTAFLSRLGYKAPKLDTICFRGTVVPAPAEAFYRVAEEVRIDRDRSLSFPNLWEEI
ncbi:hypothetical protein EXIGLDRAFT_727635 [Exidia glandulosa HHB12029]|uniref:Uncharacterized protein n=1 Tax=Exidia glandulosa HHB12029 TaxID=1314781 RepID=A0A165LZK7_EXIGL|nr:hypothetical protein EXIGLDRAFT_727635 [Exidia glandulosa HHB12029]